MLCSAVPIALGTDIVKLSNPTFTTLDCVANDVQGKIQDLWLAVCADTADCFSSTSQASLIDFTIGSDSTCEIGDTGYCNGPLPSNTLFKILVIICKNAGCVPVSSELVATKGEEANYTALAIGLGIGLPCIIILIIVAVMCIKLRLRNKKLESMRRQEPLYNTPSRTFQDYHLYGVANDNMTPVVSEPEEVSQLARNEDVYQEIPDYNNFPDERFQIYQNIETAVERS
ncbi:uncharacterized protein LOC131957766 [Physella acuta]|uniref:uncharacterized protein LOC131957766 n=1 Tax=Physella acuta TaxID=109671 RepID=UPI0027DC91EB|nr:uncharacterized protein LOC131957766 [Physella acuta]